MESYSILNKINKPADLKNLNRRQLKELCFEIRKKIIYTVSQTGGHLSSNLGVVELTVALEREFNLPYDKIVWDVGHQCYPHKLITGRFNNFDTLRQKDGISGFPKPNESVYDSFACGHASTSLSVATGLAKAELLSGGNNMVIAVIGDGALTGGMAYEALNNAPGLTNLIIVLNYNEMSISKTVGGFAKYLSDMRAKQSYLLVRNTLNRILDNTPYVGKKLKQYLLDSKSIIKDLLYDKNLFTDFGFSYLGPVDGHNLTALKNALNWAKNTPRPALIQVFTKKGRGYKPAEENPSLFHGISKFNIKTGKPEKSNEQSFSCCFGKTLCKMVEKDKRICAITAAMRDGTGLLEFSKKFKDNFFDVGIAEEHAVTFASGLAKEGMLPVFVVYSTFLQRGYDQLLHDAALNDAHIVLGVDRAGIVGEDGETHQGVFDVSFASTIPNTTIFSPATFDELSAVLKRGVYGTSGVVFIRYPRGPEPKNIKKFPIPAADFQIIGKGDILIITYGRLTSEVLKAKDSLEKMGINISVLKLCKIHPISDSVIKIVFGYKYIFFFEEGIQKGGVGESLCAKLYVNGFKGKYFARGIDNCFVKHSTVSQAIKDLKLDSVSIVNLISDNFKSKKLKEMQERI